MQSPLGSFLVIWLKEVRVKKRIVRILTINLTIRLRFLTIIRAFQMMDLKSIARCYSYIPGTNDRGNKPLFIEYAACFCRY